MITMDYTTEIKIDDDEIIAYIQKNKRPDEVFEERELRDWALDNGFVEES